MSQSVPPTNSPEYFCSSKQTVPFTPMPPERDEYMLNQEDTPTAPLPAMPAGSSVSLKQRSSWRFPALLIMILLLAMIGAGLGAALLRVGTHSTSAPVLPMIVGHLSFLSSDQLSENSSQGICDEVEIEIDHLAPPAPGKRYYAWLLHDIGQGEANDLLLGVLSVDHGIAHLFYPGDEEHSNLLAVMSRFLVTEEDATVTPVNPSPDESTWRYYGEIAQQPVTSSDGLAGTSQFSYLDHLRHLLASDPLLDELELPGGLVIWLYRNTGKVMEWSMSMRESWEENKDIGFLRRQTARILIYLDGISYVQQDLPPDTSLPVNERLAGLGLLDVQGPSQDPPALLQHIVFHLNGLIQTSRSPGLLRKQTAGIIVALSNVQFWLEQLRSLARQLLSATDAKLFDSATLGLLNDMIDDASHAYGGQTDPVAGQVHEGVTWIHDVAQAFATLDITTYTGRSSSIQMIQDTRHPEAMRSTS
jgi:hypothetical protein